MIFEMKRKKKFNEFYVSHQQENMWKRFTLFGRKKTGKTSEKSKYYE